MLNKRKAKRQTPRHRQYLEGFKKSWDFSSMFLYVVSLNYSGTVKGSTLTQHYFFSASYYDKQVASGNLY